MHVLWLYFGWPDGAVWGNAIAEPIVVVMGGVVAWIWRDRIGRRVAAWWAHHHHEHAVAQHLEALSRYAAGEDARPHAPKEGM